MAAPYRAQRQSLNEIGGPQDRGGGPGYAAVVDSLLHGTSSLIQQAYQRKLIERQNQQQTDQIRYQRQRDSMEDARADRKEKFERDKFTHERAKDRQEAIYKGYHEPAPAGQSAIKDAMTGHPAEPHFDVDRSVPYRTAVDRTVVAAEAAKQRQNERLEAQQKGREFAAKASQDLARLRASLAKDKAGAGGIGRAMTAGQRETMLQKTAAGLLAQTNGSYDDAVALMKDTPEGQALVKEGLLPRHLMIAHGMYVNTASGQAISMQRSLGEDVGESVERVRTTREAVRGSGGPKAPPKAGAAPAPAAPAPAPAAKLKAPAPAAGGAAKPKSFTPDETRARALQLKQEGKTNADILKIMQGEGYNVVDSSKK